MLPWFDLDLLAHHPVVGDIRESPGAEITTITGMRSVSGTLYGSAWLLYVVMLIGVWVLLAPFGLWNIGTAIATAVAMLALVWMARRQATVTVADTGVRYGFTSPMLPGYDGGFEVPWDNIQGIKGTWLSGSVVFKHPQKLVRKTKKSMVISFLDPKWRARPTSMAIVHRLEDPWEPSSG